MSWNEAGREGQPLKMCLLHSPIETQGVRGEWEGGKEGGRVRGRKKEEGKKGKKRNKIKKKLTRDSFLDHKAGKKTWS